MKNNLLFTLGIAVCITGVMLTLRNFDAAVIVFQGVVPALLAIVGLVIMFAAGIKK